MAVYSRCSVLHAATTNSDSAPTATKSTNFDTNIIVIVAVLFCVLICALGVNFFVRCALRISGRHELPVQILLARIAVRRQVIRKLPVVVYSAGPKFGSTSSECAICLAELEPGDIVRKLPMCGHSFHVRCVDKWLIAQPTCPTCRHRLFANSQKSPDCSRSEQENRITIEPLEREGIVTDFRI